MKYKMYAQRVFCFHWKECFSFYKDTIGLPVKFESEEMGWAEFDIGGVSLALERQDETDAEAQSFVGRFVGISLQVDDIDVIYQELTGKGVEFEGPPAKQPWGGVLAHFKDPDGNTLTLLGGVNG
jgi:lactoylglutathione lyase